MKFVKVAEKKEIQFAAERCLFLALLFAFKNQKKKSVREMHSDVEHELEHARCRRDSTFSFAQCALPATSRFVLSLAKAISNDVNLIYWITEHKFSHSTLLKIYVS